MKIVGSYSKWILRSVEQKCDTQNMPFQAHHPSFVQARPTLLLGPLDPEMAAQQSLPAEGTYFPRPRITFQASPTFSRARIAR